MTTLNVSLPDTLRDFSEERVAQGRLDALLQEGLDSGPATPMTPQDWGDIRREVQRRTSVAVPQSEVKSRGR